MADKRQMILDRLYIAKKAMYEIDSLVFCVSCEGCPLLHTDCDTITETKHYISDMIDDLEN